MFDFKKDFFSLKFIKLIFCAEIFHVWCPQKMTLIFKKYFLGKISFLSHLIMREEKKGEKGIPPFFPNHPTPPKK
jgi:hypothetical protein